MRKAKLDLSKCSAEDINTFPDMKVDGEVELPWLNGNKEIKRIPILGLGVGWGWSLNLSGCESLTSLPKGLDVMGNLWLGGCKLLTSLPQDLKVGGDIYYNSDTGFAKIKGWKNKPEIIHRHLKDKLKFKK